MDFRAEVEGLVEGYRNQKSPDGIKILNGLLAIIASHKRRKRNPDRYMGGYTTHKHGRLVVKQERSHDE